MARIPGMVSTVRIVIGNCPRCGAVLAETNHGETWPLMTCQARDACDWKGPTTELFNKHIFAQVPPKWLSFQAPECTRFVFTPIPEVVDRLAEGRDPVTGR